MTFDADSVYQCVVKKGEEENGKHSKDEYLITETGVVDIGLSLW